MINLEVFNIEFLEITALSVSYKLPPAICPVFSRVLLTSQLLQGLNHGVVCRVEEKWYGEPFPLWVHHHPVLYALILVIAPNLKLVLDSKEFACNGSSGFFQSVLQLVISS